LQLHLKRLIHCAPISRLECPAFGHLARSRQHT
jgi:hypothetical protein